MYICTQWMPLAQDASSYMSTAMHIYAYFKKQAPFGPRTRTALGPWTSVAALWQRRGGNPMGWPKGLVDSMREMATQGLTVRLPSIKLYALQMHDAHMC